MANFCPCDGSSGAGRQHASKTKPKTSWTNDILNYWIWAYLSVSWCSFETFGGALSKLIEEILELTRENRSIDQERQQRCSKVWDEKSIKRRKIIRMRCRVQCSCAKTMAWREMQSQGLVTHLHEREDHRKTRSVTYPQKRMDKWCHPSQIWVLCIYQSWLFSLRRSRG